MSSGVPPSPLRTSSNFAPISQARLSVCFSLGPDRALNYPDFPGVNGPMLLLEVARHCSTELQEPSQACNLHLLRKRSPLRYFRRVPFLPTKLLESAGRAKDHRQSNTGRSRTALQ